MNDHVFLPLHQSVRLTAYKGNNLTNAIPPIQPCISQVVLAARLPSMSPGLSQFDTNSFVMSAFHRQHLIFFDLWVAPQLENREIGNKGFRLLDWSLIYCCNSILETCEAARN